MADDVPIVLPADGGEYARVPAAVAPVVAPVLEYPTPRSRMAGKRVTDQSATGSLGQLGDDALHFPAKLAPWVYDRLAQAGYRPAVRRGITPFGWRPDLPPLGPAAGPIAAALNDPAAALGGLIRVGPGVVPEAIVPELVRRFPAGRAVVAVKNNADQERWLGVLWAAELQQPVGTAREVGANDDDPKVLVATHYQLSLCEWKYFDLAIVLEARALARSAAPLRDYEGWEPGVPLPRSYDLLWHWAVPAFGFIPAEYDPRPEEHLRLRSMFGRVLNPNAGETI